MSEHVVIDAIDAIELAELLEFVHDLIGSHPVAIDDAMNRFVGSGGYDTDDLAWDARCLAEKLRQAMPDPTGAAG